MDISKTIDQVLNMLGQIHVSGWDDIQCLVGANLLLSNLKDDLKKQNKTSCDSIVKESE